MVVALVVVVVVVVVGSGSGSSSNNSNKLLYLHDSIILQYCKSMHMTIKI